MKFKFLKASVAGLIFSASCLANAGLINVDFQGGNNTYGGQGVLGSASDTVWNPVANSGTSLLFSDGSGASSISVSVSGFIANHSNGAQTNPILNDWLYGNGSNPMTISIEGLAANSIFDLAFYNGFYWQDFTIQGQPGLIASTRPNGSSSSISGPFSSDKYAILQSVMSDASGTITILDTPLSGVPYGRNSSIAGLQIQSVSVPEPSTLAIFALGMIGLASRRFKKKS
jgi:hypothetical protein